MPKPVLLQFTFDDSQLTIIRHIPRNKCTEGRSEQIYAIRTIHIWRCLRWQFLSQLPSARLNAIIYVTGDVRSLPPRLQKSYTTIYGQRLCNDTTIITDFFRQLMGRFQEVEQRSQIIQFAITIGNYHLIGRPNRIVVRSESHLRQLYSISSNKSMTMDQLPTSEYGSVPIRWHTKRVFRNSMEMIFICRRDSQNPRGYRRMDRLGTEVASGFSMYLRRVDVQLMGGIPSREWTVLGCQTVPIGCDKYVIRSMSLFVQIGGSRGGRTV